MLFNLRFFHIFLFQLVEIFVEPQLHLPSCLSQTRCIFYYTQSEDLVSLQEVLTSQFKQLIKVKTKLFPLYSTKLIG